MSILNWNFDPVTLFWANRCILDIGDIPEAQALGNELNINTWVDRILNENFPESIINDEGHLICSPDNIIGCIGENLLLESLVLTIGWGSMWRRKRYIYGDFDLIYIQEILNETIHLILEANSIEPAWEMLSENLNWSNVMISKYLHFLCRAYDFSFNPPVPIDNAVAIKIIWPAFLHMVEQHNIPQHLVDANPSQPRNWNNKDSQWKAYNRYMTVISCWAAIKGWTTTQIECTLFEEFG
jgi:hypothetical protein